MLNTFSYLTLLATTACDYRKLLKHCTSSHISEVRSCFVSTVEFSTVNYNIVAMHFAREDESRHPYINMYQSLEIGQEIRD